MEGHELIKISNKHKIANYCSILILVVLVSVSVFLVMWNAEWTLGDDNQFITTTVIGKIVKGWSGAGRFWPLGLFDCSILILIPYGYTFTMHMAYCSLTLIVSSVLMFNLIKKITNHWISIISLTVLFFSSAFMRIHMLCTFPERFMFTLLSFIMFCLWMAYKNQKIKYYVAALLASIYVTYTKEPTFGAMLIIALTNLMFGKLNKKQVYFYCLLMLNSFVYLLNYMSLKKKTVPTLISIDSIFGQLTAEPLLWGVIILGLYRAIYVAFLKDRKSLLTDSFLFAGCGYMCAIFLLGLVSDYYTFPTLVLSLPAFAKYLNEIICKRKVSLILITTIILIPTFTQSLNQELKNIKYIQKCRAGDMSAIKHLINQNKIGKNIVFVMAKESNNERWCSNLPFDAMKYVFNYEPSSYIRQTGFKGINSNTILIMPSWYVKRLKLKEIRELNGFESYYKNSFINIFTYSQFKASNLNK